MPCANSLRAGRRAEALPAPYGGADPLVCAGPPGPAAPTPAHVTSGSEPDNLLPIGDLRGEQYDDRSIRKASTRASESRLFAPDFRPDCHHVNCRRGAAVL